MPKDVKVTLHFYSGQDDDLIAWMESLHVSYGKKGQALKDVLRQGLGPTTSDKPAFTSPNPDLDKSFLTDGLTSDERAIAERAMSETDGKISRETLMGWGFGQREARRLQDAWKMRGWAANDPQRANGLYLTPEMADLLTDQPARPTDQLARSTDQSARPTDQSARPTDQPARPTRPTSPTNPTNRLAAFMAANPVTKQEETPPASGPKKLSIDSEHW